MSIILSDAGHHSHLLPLTATRPVGQLRPGILRLSEGWYVRTGLGVGFRTEQYLSSAFPLPVESAEHEVDAAVFPTDELAAAVLDMVPGQVLMSAERAIAFCTEGKGQPALADWAHPPSYFTRIPFGGKVVRFTRPWHLFQHCGFAIEQDFALLTEGRRSEPLSALNTVIGDPEHIFLEKGAKVEACILNTNAGPIYIGKDAEVMEGSMLRGPIVVGDHAQVKMGAKIYGPCAFGPESRIGGEVNNSVVQGFSNKGHDGFMGNSVLGEWCNLGADTNTSNLKNTYSNVQVWSDAAMAMVDTGTNFCGLVMGDHGKTGINTMFNTGTVVGVAANVFGGGFPPKHIPGFTWGGADGLEVHDIERALTTARRVMERRHVTMTALDEAILRHLFETGQAK